MILVIYVEEILSMRVLLMNTAEETNEINAFC